MSLSVEPTNKYYILRTVHVAGRARVYVTRLCETPQQRAEMQSSIHNRCKVVLNAESTHKIWAYYAAAMSMSV